MQAGQPQQPPVELQKVQMEQQAKQQQMQMQMQMEQQKMQDEFELAKYKIDRQVELDYQIAVLNANSKENVAAMSAEL
jgi:hypothetical protein